jgi:hypothetical protein
MVLPQDIRTVLGEELSPESPVAVILSSYFSGGWLSMQQSVMAAVAAHQVSDSLQRSGSGCISGASDRARGSRGQVPEGRPNELGLSRGFLEKVIATYHSLNPDRETAAGNVSVEAKIALFQGLVPGRQFSSADALWLVIALKTRNWLGQAADAYANNLGLRPFRTFAVFDEPIR